MNSFRNPRWSLPITVIPVAIFLWIHYGTYQIVSAELTSEQSNQWLIYGMVLTFIWVLHSGLTLFMIMNGSSLEKIYGRITFWAYMLFVFLYLGNFYHMIPPSIPDWVASGNKRLYILIFIAPTLAHSLTTINVSLDAATVTFTKGKVAALTGSFFICGTLLLIFPKVEPGTAHYITILLLLLFSTVFVDNLIKVVDVDRLNTFFIRGKYIAFVKPILAVSFLLTGMFLDNDILLNAGFGNFSNLSFYLWCILNGLATCAPDFKHKTYRMVVFISRSLTYSYIVWFMITFIPRLPLSAIAISSFGLGYIMVTPLIIIIFHTRLLVNDAAFLYYYVPRRTIRIMFVLAASLSMLLNTFEMLYVS